MSIPMESLFLYLPIYLALYVVTKHLLNKIQNLPPSPFPSLPIIGHLYLLKPPMYRTLAQISKRKGPVVLLQFGSRKVLLVSSPSAAEECFTKNDIIFANRPRLLIGKQLGYNYTGLAWAPYGDHWRNLRRIATLEILSAARLQVLYSIRIDEIRSLIHRLFPKQFQSVDLKTMFNELTMNVMMTMIAGKRYYGDDVTNLEEANRFKEIQAETFKVSGTTNIGDHLPWIKSRELEKRMMECGRKRDEFMQELLEEHRKEKGTYISAEKTKTLVLLIAGTDTTTNSMEWTFSLLLNHPEILKKAQTEIDNRVGHGRLLDETDLVHLPFLRNIINGSLRMYPVAPLLVPHESSDDCKVGGFHVPRGTMLMVNMWAIQNDPKIWVDPRKFKPVRFDGVEGGRDGFRSMPFRSGRRGCPGEGLALRMIGLTLGSLIRCFEWERPSKEMIGMREGIGFTMPKAQPLIGKCHPRPTMLKLLSQT
ncbi:hypothetical protein Pint_08687 [Pistacia integerrima]|uniref:Uncharacterized protein n=1 Tax=Pistacia integerrima TaxID=434235 RepID=A0ACC0XX23_9ROSI|nr:hypothetical protein Pint_08687 [Pistacia integerrima]